MQADKYNEWYYLPQSLRPEEIEKPMNVINNFFDHDSLPGHLEILRKWCYTLLKDDFYGNEQGSPSGLLYHHELTLNLVEAAYLLKDKGERSAVCASIEQLGREQFDWSFHPSNLNQEISSCVKSNSKVQNY